MLTEDELIATRVAFRLAHDDGTRVTLEELDERLGFSAEDVARAAGELAAELGIDLDAAGTTGE